MEPSSSNVLPFPAQPSDDDLELVEQSCRRLAESYRTGAPGFWLPGRARALEIAEEFEQRAERLRSRRAHARG